MTPGKYEELAMRTEANQEHVLERIVKLGSQAVRLDNGVRGLTDEVGELNGCIKRWLEYGQLLDIPNIQEEVGDCLWRLVQICQAVGYSLEQAMMHNIEKLRVRYPNGYTDSQATEHNRDRTAERLVVDGTSKGFEENSVQQIQAEPLNYVGNPNLPKYSSAGGGGPGGVQNGQGWAESPLELPEAEPQIVPSYGDGLVRELLDTSYNRLCNQCNKAKVHRTNSTGICPDCACDIRAGRRTLIDSSN